MMDEQTTAQEPEQQQADIKTEIDAAQGAGATEAAAEPQQQPAEQRPDEQLVPLTAMTEERRKRQELERQLQALQQTQQAPQQPPQPQGEPRMDDYATYEQYEQARERHRVDQVTRRVMAQQHAIAQKQAMQQAYRGFESRALSKKDAPTDYMDSIQALVTGQHPVSEVVRDVILNDEAGPDLAYHLGKNPAELYRIAQLPPGMQAAKMARIADSLKAKRVSSAPPPISPTGTQSATAAQDPEKMSPDQWLKWRNAQLASKGK